MLLACFSYTTLIYANNSALHEIEHLVSKGDYNSAYREAEAILVQEEGNPKFDYLFGLTAVKSNHNGPALFALERVLIVEPDNYQARYYYALAFYQSKLYAKAYLEARSLQNKPISTELSEDVVKLILKVTRENKSRKQKWVFVSVAGGYDSNVNGGVDETGIQLVNVGFVPLEADSKVFKSNYLETKVGAGIVIPLHGKLTGQVMGNWRRNESAHLFDTDDYALYLKYQFPFSDYQFSLPVIIERKNLDHHKFRNSHSAGLEIAYPATQTFTMRPYFRVIELDYPKDPSQTSNVYWGGLGFETMHAWNAFSVIQPFYGSQQINDHQYRYNGRSFGGLEYSLRFLKFDKKIPFMYLTYQRSDYHHPHALIGTGREMRGDDYYRGEMGMDWSFADHFYLTLSGVREVNESNINVFEYRRNIAKVSVTYSSL